VQGTLTPIATTGYHAHTAPGHPMPVLLSASPAQDGGGNGITGANGCVNFNWQAPGYSGWYLVHFVPLYQDPCGSCVVTRNFKELGWNILYHRRSMGDLNSWCGESVPQLGRQRDPGPLVLRRDHDLVCDLDALIAAVQREGDRLALQLFPLAVCAEAEAFDHTRDITLHARVCPLVKGLPRLQPRDRVLTAMCLLGSSGCLSGLGSEGLNLCFNLLRVAFPPLPLPFPFDGAEFRLNLLRVAGRPQPGRDQSPLSLAKVGIVSLP
jgi:hypothetical protein